MKDKVTVSTPTYKMTQVNPRISEIIGWALFFIFIFAIALIGVGAFFILSIPMLAWMKAAIVTGIFVAIFLLIVMYLICDTLNGILSVLGRSEARLKEIEEKIYLLVTYLTEKDQRG